MVSHQPPLLAIGRLADGPHDRPDRGRINRAGGTLDAHALANGAPFHTLEGSGQIGRDPRVESCSHRDGILCQLLGLLLQHWVMLTTGWQWVDRSLVLMGQAIREEFRSLCWLWHDLVSLSLWCSRLARILWKTARIGSHTYEPSTAFRMVTA